MTYSKKEIADKLGFVMPSNRINYDRLKIELKERGVLDSLNMSEQQYDAHRNRRFNAIQSKQIGEILGI
jgi:hypothetical protein